MLHHEHEIAVLLSQLDIGQVGALEFVLVERPKHLVAHPDELRVTALGREPVPGGSTDFVLFDAPPSFGPLTLNVLRACDEVVVPVPLQKLKSQITSTAMAPKPRGGHHQAARG